MDILEYINNIDIDIILWMNDKHNSILDVIMIGLSDKFIHIPLYLSLLYLLYKTTQIKGFILSLVLLAIMILIADQGASGFAKPYFERLRPCYLLDLNIPDGCGGQYGFFSSHASNSFAVAVFFSLVFHNKKWRYSLITWASLVSLSRVYLAQHYISDISTGALYGSIVATLVYLVFKKFKLQNL